MGGGLPDNGLEFGGIDQGDSTVPDAHELPVYEPAQFLVDVLARGHEQCSQILLRQTDAERHAIVIGVAVAFAERK